MRHYYGYTPAGKLWWTFVHTGGFPAGCDLDDPNCTDPLVVHLLANYGVNQTHSETLQGIVKYDCPCDPEVGICDCPPTKRALTFSDADGVMVDKPVTEMVISGSVVATDATITKYPSQVFTIKLQEVTPDSMPDGATATVYSDEMLETGLGELTFTAGATNEVTLRAPAQGVTGNIFIDGLMIIPSRAFVKGYVTT